MSDLDRYSSRVLAEFVAKRKVERAIAARGRANVRAGAEFAGGLNGRLTAAMAGYSLALNADLDTALVPLRSRARQLAHNTDFGRRFLSLVANNVIGRHGPLLQVRAKLASGTLDKPANDAVEMAWSRYLPQFDIRQQMSLAWLQRVGIKAVARDGEVLVRKVVSRNAFRLQLLEADRLDESLNQFSRTTGNWIRQGVEMDGAMRPLAYHIKTAHPGETWRGAQVYETERVPAEQILHLFVPERPEQVRGYSWLHAVIIKSGLLHQFTESAVVAARVGASKMGVFTRELDAADDALKQLADGQDGEALHMNAEAGEFIELPAGYDLKSWDPQFPNETFDSFVKACMRSISAGLDVAAHNLSGDMTDVNYSSARIAELAEREMWMALQDWWIDSALVPIYRQWLQWSLLRGDVTFESSGAALPADRFDKFFNASFFRGRRWQWVDPSKDIEAKREAVALKVTSRTRIAAEEGVEWDDVVTELADEERVMKESGLASAPAAAASASPDKSADQSKALERESKALRERLSEQTHVVASLSEGMERLQAHASTAEQARESERQEWRDRLAKLEFSLRADLQGSVDTFLQAFLVQRGQSEETAIAVSELKNGFQGLLDFVTHLKAADERARELALIEPALAPESNAPAQSE